ncbi:hypothetical protein RJ640_028452 [Escallonia rubra]|uniref:Uncharacterized protein n=1 Tax=Escallonia rubra TaxID=112253 RepID=A0AA88QTG9_9ASTE|nr:hypothetical protein RJ640_028452 [Escallonia rubra]
MSEARDTRLRHTVPGGTPEINDVSVADILITDYHIMFHENKVAILVRVFFGVALHLLCSYNTFPLYALVTQISLLEMPEHRRKKMMSLTTNVMRDDSDKVLVLGQPGEEVLISRDVTFDEFLMLSKKEELIDVGKDHGVIEKVELEVRALVSLPKIPTDKEDGSHSTEENEESQEQQAGENADSEKNNKETPFFPSQFDFARS